MKDFYVLPVLFLALLYLFPVIAHSSEIRNTTIQQAGNRIRFEYDLEGTGPEVGVVITVTVEGKSYSQKDLHLEGDIGKVKPGKGKSIVWNVLQDFPRGLAGEFTWKIEAETPITISTETVLLDHRQVFSLLRNLYYRPFVLEEYAACFKCHNKDMVIEKTIGNSSNNITKFRNGDRNLHFQHVNKEKGRNCIACHRVNEEGKLEYAKEVPFGKSWKLPVNVTLTNSGGSCVVGCHKPKEYNRDKPVTN